jgi:hypothetical protein
MTGVLRGLGGSTCPGGAFRVLIVTCKSSGGIFPWNTGMQPPIVENTTTHQSPGSMPILSPLISTLARVRGACPAGGGVVDALRVEPLRVRKTGRAGLLVHASVAALSINDFAKEVEFLSIGTNDLLQNALVVDGTHETVADSYNFGNSALLRLIAMAVEAVPAGGIEANVRGTTGEEPLSAAVVSRLGVQQLSVPTYLRSETKRGIRGIRDDCGTHSGRSQVASRAGCQGIRFAPDGLTLGVSRTDERKPTTRFESRRTAPTPQTVARSTSHSGSLSESESESGQDLSVPATPRDDLARMRAVAKSGPTSSR